VHRLDIDELLDIFAPIAPGEEAPAGVKVRRTRIRVVDRDGEEFQKAARGSVAGRRDDRRPPKRREIARGNSRRFLYAA
jgi:hypothetical protein